MKLEHLQHVVEGEDLIRLYDFNQVDAKRLHDAIMTNLIEQEQVVHLAALDFIESVNCTLTLTIASQDQGIRQVGHGAFECAMSLDGYRQMNALIQPFIDEPRTGYQWLYDLESDVTPFEFLLSPSGRW